MNLLFHMYLSGDDHELLVGNFMGDFVKGRLDDTFPVRVRHGLLLHRKIDSFAQRSRYFQASRLRLSPYFGLYRGVLVDLFYDHFLVTGWKQYSAIPLQEYIVATRSIIEQHRVLLPHRLQEFVPVIFNELLPSYGRIAGIEAALSRMARRVKRPNPLAEGGDELKLHYRELQADFEKFIVSVMQYAAAAIANGDLE